MRGTATMLIGGPGSGKTYSLSTFIEAGLELFCVFTEPGGEESLIRSVEERGLDINKVHWQYIPPAAPSFETMMANAKTIGTMSYESLTSIKAGMNKQGYQQYVKLLEALSDFKCDRDGKSYGPVDSWGSERALALDSLSGINIMAMDLVVGGKPVKHPGEWGVAMDTEERLVSKLCCDIDAFFVLIAHVEREMNEVTGGVNLMAGALGKKLAPKLPRFFSDVVFAYRDETEFFWSTIFQGVDTKTRTLPLAEKIPPSFVQVVEAWNKRADAAGDTSPSVVAVNP